MSGLFGGGRPSTPSPPPRVDTEGVQAAGDAERRRQRAAAGRGATMLSGGLTSQANVGTSALLGG